MTLRARLCWQLAEVAESASVRLEMLSAWLRPATPAKPEVKRERVKRKAQPTVGRSGEDLDAPTYQRRGVRLRE
jgi:hypothetical protein